MRFRVWGGGGGLVEGSWIVVSRVITRLYKVVTRCILVFPRTKTTTHEPPSVV